MVSINFGFDEDRRWGCRFVVNLLDDYEDDVKQIRQVLGEAKKVLETGLSIPSFLEGLAKAT